MNLDYVLKYLATRLIFFTASHYLRPLSTKFALVF